METVLSAKHRPFEISLLVVSFLIGVRGLITTNTSGVLYQSVGDWANAWSIGLIIGPGICLATLFLKLPDNLLWERVGIVLMLTVFASYAITGFIVTGNLNFNYAFVAIIVCLGGVGRIVQISLDLKLIRKTLAVSRNGS